jgi:16S rRNA (adenine1518-N6/adenine1519-N6)-dimethyltransferase
MRADASGFRARRRWGQNFLVNRGAVEAILTAFHPLPTDRVMEIGPGKGALTELLIARVGRVLAIEVDSSLARSLRERLEPLPGYGHLEVIQADILEIELGDLLLRLGAAEHPARLIANLPYNIATAVILRCLEQKALLSDLMVMVQREVAERILSLPGRRTYGSLSVLCQAFARIDRVMHLRPGSFRPRPRVDSEVIRFTLERDGPAWDTDGRDLSALLRVAFEHRRKTLLNNLSHRSCRGRSTAAIESMIREAGLDPGCRPEDVTVADYMTLLEHWRAL